MLRCPTYIFNNEHAHTHVTVLNQIFVVTIIKISKHFYCQTKKWVKRNCERNSNDGRSNAFEEF